MSELPASNETCYHIPAVQVEYTPIGKIVKMGEYDEVYVVGDESSSTVVFCLFDVYGFALQTQQGADILANAIGARLIMPDVFFGHSLNAAEYPYPDEEKNKKAMSYFRGTAHFEAQWPKLSTLITSIRQDPKVKNVYLYGLCWGGKCANFVGVQTLEVDGYSGPAVDAIASIHPGRLLVEDATNLNIPMALFPSSGESIDEYTKTVELLKTKPFASKCAYRYYPTMPHGWAGARGDWSKEEHRKEFEDVYARLATFFKNVGET